MNISLKNMLLIGTLLVPVAQAAEVKNSLKIMPGKISEKCFVLASNESINYSFSTSNAVAFNIHYHIGQSVKYPIKLNSVSKKSGVFKATLKQNYCLMWTNNNSQTTQLNYTVKKN